MPLWYVSASKRDEEAVTLELLSMTSAARRDSIGVQPIKFLDPPPRYATIKFLDRFQQLRQSELPEDICALPVPVVQKHPLRVLALFRSTSEVNVCVEDSSSVTFYNFSGIQVTPAFQEMKKLTN